MPELPVPSWQFLESHRSLLFMQLFTILPNYNVLGMKYALGFQAAVSVIYCQHDFECTQGSAEQGCHPTLQAALGHTAHMITLCFIPTSLCCSLRGRGSISEPSYCMCRDLSAPGITTVQYVPYFSSVLLLKAKFLCGLLDPLHLVYKEHLQVPCKLFRVFIETRPKK